MFISAQTVLTTIADPMGMVFYELERIEARIDNEINTAATPPVAAIGTAFGHELFAPKTGTAVTARPTTGEHACSIDKHIGPTRRVSLLGGRVHDVYTLPAFFEEPELNDAVFERE